MKICRIGLLMLLSSFFLSAYTQEDLEIKELLTQLSTANEDTSKVNLLLELANLTSWSDIVLCEQYARQAFRLSQELNYVKGLAYAEYQLAKIFVDYEFDFSESLLFGSLEFAKAIDDSLFMARIYSVLGNLKFNVNHREDAMKYYDKSLGIYIRHHMEGSTAGTYNNIGMLYSNIFNDTLAIGYFLKAVEINKKTEKFSWLAINFLNLGFEYLEIGKLNLGMDYLQQSLELANKHDLRRLYPFIYNNLSYFYFEKKDFKESVKYAGKALQFARDQVNRLQEKDALSYLSKAYLKMQAPEMAYDYLLQLNIVSDSINKHNRLKELDLLEMRYNFEKERNRQQLENALLEKELYRKERTFSLILTAAGLIIITFLFLYLLQRNRMHRKNLEQKNTLLEKEKLSKELEYKNKELTTNVMYLLKKNEFISKISGELKLANLDGEEPENNAIVRIISELDKSISDDIWTEFEVRFQEVQIDFYNRLSNRYPNLTPNELRLCAFLRLNMTTKEIADITFQSLDSLKTARYRLRKKLGLERDDNLVSFFTQF